MKFQGFLKNIFNFSGITARIITEMAGAGQILSTLCITLLLMIG